MTYEIFNTKQNWEVELRGKRTKNTYQNHQSEQKHCFCHSSFKIFV